MPHVGQGLPVAMSMPHGGQPNCRCVPWPAGSGESIAANTSGARQASATPAAPNRRPKVDGGTCGVVWRDSGKLAAGAGTMRLRTDTRRWTRGMQETGIAILGGARPYHRHSWRCVLPLCLHLNQATLGRAQPRHTQNSTKSNPFSRLPPRAFLAISLRTLRSSRREARLFGLHRRAVRHQDTAGNGGGTLHLL